MLRPRQGRQRHAEVRHRDQPSGPACPPPSPPPGTLYTPCAGACTRRITRGHATGSCWLAHVKRCLASCGWTSAARGRRRSATRQAGRDSRGTGLREGPGERQGQGAGLRADRPQPPEPGGGPPGESARVFAGPAGPAPRPGGDPKKATRARGVPSHTAQRRPPPRLVTRRSRESTRERFPPSRHGRTRSPSHSRLASTAEDLCPVVDCAGQYGRCGPWPCEDVRTLPPATSPADAEPTGTRHLYGLVGSYNHVHDHRCGDSDPRRSEPLRVAHIQHRWHSSTGLRSGRLGPVRFPESDGPENNKVLGIPLGLQISIDTGSVVPSGQEAQADAATQARVSEMVSEITKSSKTRIHRFDGACAPAQIEELVEALPEHDQNEARQTEELNSLQKESDRLAQELEKELQRVRIVLGEVSHCYADIVDAQLARQLKTPGGSSTAWLSTPWPAAVNVGLEGTVPWQQNT
eukprot:scaffold1388_cov390-Prasinococcus_capsulatus_cf.AAC.21